MLNPASGTLLTKVAAASKEDVDAAVQSCADAPNVWKQVPPFVRSSLLHKYADKIVENMDELTTLESTDVGKPIGDSVADAMVSSGIVRYYAGLANCIEGKAIARDAIGFAAN